MAESASYIFKVSVGHQFDSGMEHLELLEEHLVTWCNGSTLVSDTRNFGSIPDETFFLFFRKVEQNLSWERYSSRSNKSVVV